MEPTKELIDDIDRERIFRARKQPIGEKLLAGIDLFNLSCEFMRAGIRMQNPGISEERVEELLEERLALARKLEDGR